MTINPLCRDDKDERKFCRFAGTCHESRQRIQHRHGMRGDDCWAYKLRTQDAGYPGDPPDTPKAAA